MDDAYAVESVELIRDFYQRVSYTNGLIPPEAESARFYQMCGCGSGIWEKGVKVDSPSLIELRLASLQHPWMDMRKLQKEFFETMAKEVTEFESDLLKALKLPGIEQVREDAAGEEVVDNRKFKFTPTMRQAHKRILKELMWDLIGDNEIEEQQGKCFPWVNMRGMQVIIKQANVGADLKNSIFGFFMRSSLGVGLDHVWQQIVQNLPDGITEGDLDRNRVLPQFENQVFLAVVSNGADRVKHQLSQKYYHEIRDGLGQMALGEKTVIEAARYIHKQAGEGSLWHWMRVARSESVLAINAAFDEQSKAAGIRYEQWRTAASGACMICLGFEGRVWELSQGPQPVMDSHPNCRCLRVPLYNTSKPVQPRWTRETPYERPYTREELGRPLQPPEKPTAQTYTNTEDASQAMQELYENATEKDKKVTKYYTSDSYKDWNEYLRNKKSGNKRFDEATEQFNKFLDKAPKLQTTTHRGLAFGYEQTESFSKFANLKIGDTFTDNGFVSTTLNKNVAERFATESIEANGGYGVILNIKTKNGVLLDKFSQMKFEQEVVLRNGTSFKVMGKRMGSSPDIIIIDLEEI